MTYPYVKGIIIAATIFVWLRLLVGTAQQITPALNDMGNSPIVATKMEKDI